MIKESKLSGKVPAISTYEDSQEAQHKYSSSHCGPTALENSDSTAHRDGATPSDESRDIGETRRVAQEATMDRDHMESSFESDKERSSLCRAGATESSQNNAEAEEGQQTKLGTPLADNKSSVVSSTVKAPNGLVNNTKELPHHSLLPSPSTSFDHAMDGQPWSHSFNERGMTTLRVSSEKAASKPTHRRSPATSFALPSPKSKSQKQHEYGDDEASFNLLNQSFDTISDSTSYLRDYNHAESAGNRGHGDGISPSFTMLELRQHHSRDTSHGADIALPALDASQYTSVGCNISPMRIFGEGSGHARSTSAMEPIPVHFPQDEGVDARGSAYFANDGFTNQMDAGAGGSNESNPLFVLRCAREAFSKCTFLLSFVSSSNPCPVNVSEHGSFQHFQGSDNQAYHENYDPNELRIASRRVGAAICAFGGSVEPEQASKRNTTSIFRPKGNSSAETENTGKLVSNQAYEERLRKRYEVGSDGISWDVEENPPVEASDANEARNSILAHMNTGTGNSKTDPEASPRATSSATLGTFASVVEMTSNGTKMKYRCKLCGQPKQNHSCPYRQAMQRSLGVTVHPAVNSYTAHEPGDITVALSEMNNFVSYDSDQGSSEQKSDSFGPPGMGTRRRMDASVTPDTCRPGGLLATKSSSSSEKASLQESHSSDVLSDEDGNGNRKRSYSDMEVEATPVVSHDTSTPFIKEVPLRPEQYRAVTRSKNPEPVGAYQYPAIPISFAERRRLSDTLFVLSREIPNATKECSLILRDARAKDMWDLAVAELLTQVVVGLYCHEGDRCLDGLQNYLLYLGVSC